MQCKHCGESFPKNHAFEVWSIRKERVMPADTEGVMNNMLLEDAGIFCCRKCIFDYLKPADRSGVFAPRQT